MMITEYKAFTDKSCS